MGVVSFLVFIFFEREEEKENMKLGGEGGEEGGGEDREVGRIWEELGKGKKYD